MREMGAGPVPRRSSGTLGQQWPDGFQAFRSSDSRGWFGICVGRLTIFSATLLTEYERSSARAPSQFLCHSPAQMLPSLNYHLGNHHQAGLVSSGGPPYLHPPGYLYIHQIRPIPVNPPSTFQYQPVHQATLGPNFVPHAPPHFHMYYGVPTDGSAHYMQLPNRAYIPCSDMDHRVGSFEPSRGPWGNLHGLTAWNQGNRQLRSRVINRSYVGGPSSASRPNPSSSDWEKYDGNYQQEPLQHSQKYDILKMNNQDFVKYKSFIKKNSKEKNVEPLNINIEVLKSINPIIELSKGLAPAAKAK
ncbi:hypothetical protein CROQUDRAFT_92776 [Cronartium quercuum f. sp. fusiforme G11]|uniref:Uncharacterized protein n=1 Tax=Cronartium quercuum f. sp. fusiforme G11 TaxID=708437 RepID=A0A9P6NI06_9BASI|nr:hypothetical protein CROQUDRAFT_92776 [Cronartium quercuum f. sp. fusiforme G11]